MAKSRGRKFAEITSPTSGVFDLTSVPTITNAKLQNSAMTLAGSSVSLGGTGVANTDALSEGSSNLYFTNARVQSFLGGGTLAGNIVVPDNRSIYLGSDSDFRMVHNTTNTQLINATGALQITSNGGFAVTGAATFSSTVAVTGTLSSGDVTISSTAGTLTLVDSDGTQQNTIIKQSGGNLFIQARDNTSNAGIVLGGNAGGSFDEHMRILANGNVGIGTNNPGYALEVDGTGNFTGNVTAQNVINIATDSTAQTTSARQWATIKNTGTGTGDYSEMAIKNDNDDYLILGSIGSGYTNANWASSSYIYTNRELRLKSNQGIRFYSGGVTHGTNDYMILDSTGRLGIGTTSPSEELHVNSSVSGQHSRVHITKTSTAGTAGVSFNTTSSANTWTLFQEDASASKFYVYDGSDYVMTFDSTNNYVGINETNPDAPLHITSNTPIISFDESDASQEYRIGSFGGTFAIYDSTDSAYRFAVDVDGRVGIGVTNPSSYDTNSAGVSGDLVVANSGHSGIIVISGTSSDAGIFFGDGTGAGAYRGAVSYVNSQDRLYFKASGGNKMTLDTNTLNIMGPNLDVGIDTATVNFTDSVSNGNTRYIEIGANGASSLGDALLVCHSSGSGVGYLGYESGNDRLIIACDNGGGNNKIDLSVNASTGTGGSTDNLNAATPALRVHGNGNVGIHGVTSPQADLHVGHGGQEWRTSHGGNNLYISNTSWGSAATGDPNFYYGAPSGLLVTSTDSNTTGPTKPGLTLYNNDNTAGGWSPILAFSKAESGSTPYKATMAAIYARAPLGTGNGDSWIDGELWFGTSGAATNGVRGRMVLEKEGHLRPALDNNYDLGTTSYRWKNVYTTDLHLSNKVPEGTVGTDGEPIAAGNDVDGTTGDWTIQEGAEDLYIINNSTGKKYKFNLTEV